MMTCLFVSSTSASFELQNALPFYAEGAYEVFLNGERAGEFDTNVFSLFGLMPDSEYTLTLRGERLTFRTKKEAACLSVRDFGAAGDGVTDDTAAIQAAIDACPAFGRVYIGAGCYSIAPLWLKSNLTLELGEGAVLLGTAEPERHAVLPATVTGGDGRERVYSTFEGVPVPARQALLHGDSIENFALVGRGTVDGNAAASDWWSVQAQRTDVARARLIFFNNCRGVTVQGVTVTNSPAWTIHPFLCEEMDFIDLSVRSPERSPNTDGLNPESCRGVRVIGCAFSTGDDCVAIKSGRAAMARAFSCEARDYTIRNCLMEKGHGAVVLGSEIAGGVRGLSVSQCLFRGTERGVRIKSSRTRGGKSVLDGLHFENIRMEGVGTPFVINLYYRFSPDGEPAYIQARDIREVGDVPYMGAFSYKNITCHGCEVMAGYFDGLSELPIGSVRMEDVFFSFSPEAKAGYPASVYEPKPACRAGLYFDNVAALSLVNVRFEGVAGEEVVLRNVGTVERK